MQGSVVSDVQIVLPNHTGTPPAIDLEDDNLILSAVTSDSALTVHGEDLRTRDLTSPNGLRRAGLGNASNDYGNPTVTV